MKKSYKKEALIMAIQKKFEFSNIEHDSIPSDSTIERLELVEFEPFFISNTKLCHNTVPKKATTSGKYPYRSAELKHHNYDLTKRWYVEYYAWNVATEKLERVRLFEPLNRIKRLAERISKGEMMVRIVNGQLRSGKVLGKEQVEKKTPTFAAHKVSLLTAIEYVVDQKKANGLRKNYYRTFNTVKYNLAQWLEHCKQPDFSLKEFNEQDARSLFQYLRDERKLSNKTINNLIANLGTAFKFIQTYTGTKIWRNDPLRVITTLPVIAQKHPAYSDSQIETIKSALSKMEGVQYRQLELFIAFIYYLLARPNAEVCKLRIGNIELDSNRVFIPGAADKNKTDDYVELAPPLKKLITQSGIMKYPNEYFVFGPEGKPSVRQVHNNHFWRLHDKVLKETNLLSINSRYSLYSYKHSGAINLYKATKDIKLIQKQCRHRTLEQTNTYLRDLGVLTNFDQLTHWKGAI